MGFPRVDLRAEEAVIMGDINVNVGSTKTQGGQRNLKEILTNFTINNNMAQLIQEHTRSRMVNGKLQSSTIDHVYTNMPDNITDIKQTNPASSDHSMIYFTRKTGHMENPKQEQERRCFKFYNEDIFKQDLEKMNWEVVLGEQDVDKAVEKLSKNINTVLDRHAPRKTFVSTPKKKKTISQETAQEMKKRDKLWEEYKRHKTDESQQAWKDSRKRVVRYLNRDKVNMDKKDLSSPTKAWQHINNHKGPKAIRGGPPTKLLIDGTETSNSVKIAEHMNKYFINKIETNLNYIMSGHVCLINCQ